MSLPDGKAVASGRERREAGCERLWGRRHGLYQDLSWPERFYDPPRRWDAWAAARREGRRYAWVGDRNREEVRRTILRHRGACTRMSQVATADAARQGRREHDASAYWDDDTLNGLLVETVAKEWLEKSTVAECVRYRDRDDTWWFPLDP